MINFAKGHPNQGLLPLQGVQEAMMKAASSTNSPQILKGLNYPKLEAGQQVEGEQDQGDPQLRQELSSFLHRHTENDDIGSIPSWAATTPSGSSTKKKKTLSSSSRSVDNKLDMFMTHGVSHGIELLCKAQTKPGDIVLMERPTYFLIKHIFLSHGLVVKSLPMKSLGQIDVDALK